MSLSLFDTFFRFRSEVESSATNPFRERARTSLSLIWTIFRVWSFSIARYVALFDRPVL